MRHLVLLTAVLIASSASATPIQDYFLRYVRSTLACHDDPAAVPMLAYLKKTVGLNAVDQGSGWTGCWAPRRPLKLDGLPVRAVCAADDDPFMATFYPDLFPAGPGTSDGKFVSILSDAPAAQVKAWARKAGIDLSLIGPKEDFVGATEIACRAGHLVKDPTRSP